MPDSTAAPISVSPKISQIISSEIHPLRIPVLPMHEIPLTIGGEGRNWQGHEFETLVCMGVSGVGGGRGDIALPRL
jgi:hypothetical protein